MTLSARLMTQTAFQIKTDEATIHCSVSSCKRNAIKGRAVHGKHNPGVWLDRDCPHWMRQKIGG